MAGLIDAGLIRPELSNALAAGYQQAEDRRNLLSQQRQQTEMNQIKLDQLKQDREAMLQFQSQLKNAGHSPDLNRVFDAMISTGQPDYVMKGMEGKRRLAEQQRAEGILRQYAPELFPQAPATAAPVASMGGAATPPSVAPAAPTNALAAMPSAAPAAPANALAAAPAAAPAPAAAAAPGAGAPDVLALRRQLAALSSVDDPRAKAMADVLKNQIQELTKTNVVGGRLVSGAGNVLYTAPPETNDIKEYEYAKKNQGYKGSFTEFMQIKPSASAARNVVNLPVQEKEFEKTLGGGQAKRILDNKAVAEDAAQILQTNQIGRDILKSGAITGAGANFFVGLNNALKQAGVDFGYGDAAANSQAYAAAMAQNVGKIIKQFGAGTGLSDADRTYATKAAAGEITMDEKAIRKILDINDRAANYVIDKHNKDVKGIKTNIPLSVEKPTPQQKPEAANQIPGQRPSPAANIPQAAIDALRSGKGTDAQFDEIFGAGAAKRVRGGK